MSSLDSQQMNDKRMRANIQTYEHPITCESVMYSSEPIPIILEGEDGKPQELIKEIAVGDHHNVVLTVKGQVFGWGLADKGQLGVPRGKGLVNNLVSQNGI